MIYEPALVLGSTDGLHLAGDWIERSSEVGEGLRHARQAQAYGQHGNLDMVAAVAHFLPRVERIILRGQAHGGHVRDPKQLAKVMETFAKGVFEAVP